MVQAPSARADASGVRRLVAVALLALALAASPCASAASWAQAEIRTAVASGLMGPSVTAFRPADAVTRAELARIVEGVTGRDVVAVDGQRAVTMAQLDRAVVHALGLRPSAAAVRRELTGADLRPPRRVGWETVARLLGLRYNHPKEHDDRERRPFDRATRAEAAYSVARLLQLTAGDLERARAQAASFHLPALTAWQRRVLSRAIRFVGFPYVWGGMSERRQTLFGVTSRGGFDCSGFVWRVYKLEPWPEAPALNATLRGRTTYEMAGEVPVSRRIELARIRPADVLFFGRGPSSRPADVGHTGIALGGGWFVHSSGNGTTLAPLTGWYTSSFAWARRPLAEAGLR